MGNNSPKRRWFCPTPGWLIIILLIFDVMLFLVERNYWLPKGWPVLIAIAAIAVAMLLLLMWLVVALVFRRRFQFSIRSMLALVVVVAIPFSWLSVEMKWANRQPQMIAEIEQLGGTVENDLLYFSAMTSQHRAPPEPLWIRRLLGDGFFREVMVLGINIDEEKFVKISEIAGIERIQQLFLGATKITDAGSVGLRRWAGLRELSLPNATISDTGLENLKNLSELRSLYLKDTNVTDDGVKKLQKALPKCEIRR
jgi:hypothetical protein